MISNLGEIDLNGFLSLRKLAGASYWAKFAAGVIGTTPSTIFSAAGVGELYQYLESPKKVSVASTNALDNISGPGCQKIQIYGLDENFDTTTEIIELDGQTPVESVNTYVRLYRMMNISLSGHDLLGQAYCGPFDTTWVGGEPEHLLLHINGDLNQTQIGLYTVPRGYKLLVRNLIFNSHKDREVLLWMVTRSLNSVNEVENPVFRIRSNWGLYRNSATINISDTPLVLNALQEFEVRGQVVTSSTEVVHVNMNGYLIPENYFG